MTPMTKLIPHRVESRNSYSTKTTYYNTAPSSYDSPIVRSSKTYVETRVGFSNPEWRAQVADHKDATTEYTVKCLEVSEEGTPWEDTHKCYFPDGRWYWTTVNKAERIQMLTDYLPANIADVVNVVAVPAGSDAVAHAAARFFQDVKSNMTSFSGLVFLGELRSTLQLVRNPFVAILGLTKALFTQLTVLKNLGSAAQKAAELRLQYAYAIRPLIADIADGAVAFARLSKSADKRFSVKATAKWEGNPSTWSESRAYGYNVAEVTNTRSSFHSVRMVGAGTCSLAIDEQSAWSLARTSRELGLSFREILPTIWELVPFSFLVDYFFKVGEFLTTVSYHNVQLDWSSTSEKYGEVNRRIFTPLPNKAYVGGSNFYYTDTYSGSQVLSYTVKGFHRSPGVKIPTGIRVTYPNLMQGINIAALLTAIFGRR